VIVPLIGTGVKGKSVVVCAQRRLNCYLEPQVDQDKSPIVVYGTPGLVKVLDQGALVYRGGVTIGDLLYLAQGNVFEEVNNGFVATDRNAASRLTTNNGRMDFSTNEVTVVMVDGTNGYNYDTGTTAFAQIASAMFASPQATTYQDGYYLASFDRPGRTRSAARFQPTASPGTRSTSAHRHHPRRADPPVQLQRRGAPVRRQGHRILGVHGRPDLSRSSRSAARRSSVGLAARWSVSAGAQALRFLGRSRRQGPVSKPSSSSGTRRAPSRTPDI
jgi:hypothetical protein